MRAASSASSAIPTRRSASTRRAGSAIDWGVYGVPETFIVGPDGTIRYKFIGPIDEEALDKAFKPEVDKALKGG